MSGVAPLPGPAARSHRQFVGGVVLLTLSAWLLREYFVAVTIVEAPIRGDIRQYVAYAWNMLHHGTFSQVWPGSGAPVADAFRGPGYPAFLATWMWLDPESWYQAALHAQAAMGALTATMTVLLARHWLSNAWAFLAGGLVAIWPHHVAATGALLTEVAFGFLLVLALLLTAESVKRRNRGWAAGAGLAFSAAALTSLVSLLFPIFAAVVLWRERLPKAALLLVALAFAGPVAWSLRGATVDRPEGQPGRITMNLVQGAWPQYHRANASFRVNPVSRDIMQAIAREEVLLASDPRAGATRILGRMAGDPVYYGRWYLLEKPYLLWDWDIRMGAGDVYFHRVTHSPLDRHPVLRLIKQGLELFNPAAFALAALASILLLAQWIRSSPRANPVAALVAGFCVYVTVVHVVFQAEPRYSIPYRPMQMLMLAGLLPLLLSKRRRGPVA